MKIRQLLESPKINLKRLLLLFQDLLGDHLDDGVEFKTKVFNDEKVNANVYFNQDNLKHWDIRFDGGDNVSHIELYGECHNNANTFKLNTYFDKDEKMQNICNYVLFTEMNGNISLYVSGGMLGNGDDSRTYHSWKEAFIGYIDELKYVLKTD